MRVRGVGGGSGCVGEIHRIDPGGWRAADVADTRIFARHRTAVAAMVNLCCVMAAAAQPPTFESMKALSLDQLANIEVSIVAKAPRSLVDTAAAAFVITREDIRRSGATNIADLLRMVPGLQVARIDANKWAVSARGFNGRFANKLLVLMDGRSVYTPLFSGVYWNVVDTLLEDIERIEVVRGPGASVWGANAVNGVINVITRSAQDTQGNLVSAALGDETRGVGVLRHGGRWGEDVFYRIYAKYRRQADAVLPSGAQANDSWHDVRGGFRVDGQLSAVDSFNLQGDLYRNIAAQTTEVPDLDTTTVLTTQRNADQGADLLGRWYHRYANHARGTLKIAYDYQRRDETSDIRHTVAADYQYNAVPLGRHTLTGGLGYRLIHDDIPGNTVLRVTPTVNNNMLWGAFVQDEIDIDRRFRVTLGSKFERNDYTGFEYQPSARLSWRLSPRHTLWAAVSRAVRIPSRTENGIVATSSVIPAAPPLAPLATAVQVRGQTGFLAERLVAYELGYRGRYGHDLSVDGSVFYNVYHRLRTIEPGALYGSALPAFLIQPLVLMNRMHGESYGFEFAADWRTNRRLRWQLAYTFLDMQFHRDAGSRDPSAESIEGQSPEQQFSLRSSYDFGAGLDLDLWLRGVDRLSAPSERVAAYTTLDARLGWRPARGLEFSLVGRNLLDDRHLEFRDEANASKASEVERSFHLQATWHF